MQYYNKLFQTSTLLFFTVVNTQMKIHLIDLDTLDSKWRGIHLSHPKKEKDRPCNRAISTVKLIFLYYGINCE